MHEVKSIQDLLNQIGRDEILLPEFQRGYVWNKDQVRGLVRSLYRKHPTGHLLVWRTYKPSLIRGETAAGDGHSLMLLDGQQRLTTLYVLFRGKAPAFYEGEELFFDLYFNVQTGEFRFWQKTLMEKNPAWIGVHEFLAESLNGLLERLPTLDAERQQVLQANLARLSRLDQIRNYVYTVDQVTGDEFGVDEVVEIFNRVNRAGTPLTKADLALAHVCSIWPEARGEMRAFRAEMDGHGFGVDFDFLVRGLAAVATGSVLLEGSFVRTPAADLQRAWVEVQSAFRHLAGVLRHEAFIDGLDDLPTHNVLVPATVYLARHDGQFPNDAVRRRFIRWLYLAGLWTRYSGSTETKLQQDVALVSGRDVDPTHELEEAILRERGRIVLEAADLADARIDSAVGRFSHVLARANEARDWFTGIRLYDRAVGRRNGSFRHYVFSRRVLRRAGFDGSADRKRINELANRAALAQEPDKARVGVPPNEYLPEVEETQPGALQAQSIPMDRDLWDPERYEDFLAARRRLLAQAMNAFIAGWAPDDPVSPPDVRRLMATGENDRIEFKSSLRWDRREQRVNKQLEKVIVKTLAGFLNANGGTLLVGVDDAGGVDGLAADYKTLHRKDRDGFEQHLQQIVARDCGESVSPYLTVTFHEMDGQDVCHVSVDPSDHPVYVDEQQQAVFYLRVGNGTKALPVDEAVKYVQHRWGGA